MQAVVIKGSLWLPLILSIAIAGCASATDDSTQQELAQLRKDVDALNLSAHRTRGESETVLGQMDRRSREQAAESARQTAAMNSRIEALSAELTRLSARGVEPGRERELGREWIERPLHPRAYPHPGRAAVVQRPRRRGKLQGGVLGL